MTFPISKQQEERQSHHDNQIIWAPGIWGEAEEPVTVQPGEELINVYMPGEVCVCKE